MNVRLHAAFAALAGFAFAAAASAAGTGDGIWREVQETTVARNGHARQIVPDHYRTFELNRGLLTALLATAPNEQNLRAANSRVELKLPLPDGELSRFTLVESPVMEPALAAKYPDIKTYLGQSIDDPTATVRFDLTPKGFHAQIIGAEGTIYIDPFQPGDVDHYISYRKRDHTHGERGICSVTGKPVTEASMAMSPMPNLASGGMLRTYRLALAATGEYTAYHGGTVADGLAAVVTTINRVDGIYEREVAVRMVLVANEDLLIYTNPATDPYTNDNANSLLTENTTNLNNVIGSANYDIGHVAGTGGGGLAGLGVVCKTSKAQGETGSSAPIGDGYDVDYVAHEMGHQFGGNHTFNGGGTPNTASNNCTGNRAASAAYEPGSGVTIQAYAGICAADDLQPNSEDYFHRVSLNEILNYIGSQSCGTTSSTGNTAPTVTTPATFTIPGRTPFTLTASGSDPDGDALTYVWEEFDLGAANAEGVLDATVATGPIFRSFAPNTSPSRTFPSWRYILNNANAVPQTAPAPGTASPNWFAGEVLPNANRTMNFRVTVRDNRAGGGGTNEASTAIVVANTAEPFAVTAPNTAVSWATGSLQTVTWNVANTALAPVSAANVRITLSTDGGNTWPFELAASTPNDGTQNVTIPANLPNLASTQARVRVEAVGNIFFDVSDVNFTITDGSNTPPTINVTNSVGTRQGSPTASTVVATVADSEDGAAALNVSVSDVPTELAVSVQNDNGNVTLSATAACTLVAPTTGSKVYPVTLRVTDSAGATSTASVNVAVGSNQVPTLGSYATLNVTQNSVRTNVPDAAAADANGNFTGASVSPAVLPGGGTVAIAADGTVTVTTTASTTLGSYAIKPQVSDSCGATEARQFTLNVGAPQVALAIAASSVPSGNGLIEPAECNQLNVTLRNDGNVTATGVTATLSTSTPNVTISQASTSFADIPSGQSQTGTTPFQIGTTGAAVCFSNIDFTLTVNYGGAAGSPFTGSLTKTVGQPTATNYVFNASGGATLPNDGTLVAGSNASDTNSEPMVTLTTPFAFSIYGTSYAVGTSLRASTNGNLQFRGNKGADDAGNSALPAAGAGTGQNVFPAAAPTLFLQWDDWRMDPTAAGADAGIYTKVEGVAPNRSWIIEWRGRIRGDGAATSNNNRAAIVLHEGSSSFDYIYLLTGTGASANAAGSTIGIQSANTGTTFTQYALNNANIAPGTKLTASLPPAVCNAGSGTCSVPPGVTLVQSGGSTNVTEGGATDSYTVVLNAQPSGTVTISLAPDAQVTTVPTTLTFTTLDWNSPKTVTVTAVDDASVEGTHSGTIAHSASGGGYDSVVIPSVVATITDNDTAGVTVTQGGGSTDVVEGGATDSYDVVLTSQPTSTVTITITADAQVTATPATLTFSAADWNVKQTVIVAAVDDCKAEGAHTGTIAHSASGGGYDAVTIASVVANIVDNPDRISCNGFEP